MFGTRHWDGVCESGCRIPMPQPVVLGVGRARQQAGDMEGGAISRIAGVVERCRQAIDDACHGGCAANQGDCRHRW